jgi:hypothetical protein
MLLTGLMQILKETSTDWRERRLISKLALDQSIKVRLNQEETRSVKIGRGARQGFCFSPLLFIVYSEYLAREALEGCGEFKMENK